MAHLLFKLKGVPETEADEVRALLTEHQIDFYETPPSIWGVSMEAIWLRDDEQLVTAQQLLHEYQQRRILTLFDPWSDPLGAGYHSIQSMIAIGSGGAQGKGWLQGSQSQLEFIPERHTDFIFSVFSEEFGLIGVALLLSVYLFIVMRGLWIAVNAQHAFTKLLGGSITLTFFVYVFVNNFKYIFSQNIVPSPKIKILRTQTVQLKYILHASQKESLHFFSLIFTVISINQHSK